MRRFMRRFHKGEKGFTLIELLIVVAILGILAAVIVPNVATYFQTAEKGAAQAELSTVQTAVYAMMADKGFGSITGGTVNSTTDLPGDEVIAGFLQGGISQLEGQWTVVADGHITGGTYPAGASPGWTYIAPDTWERS